MLEEPLSLPDSDMIGVPTEERWKKLITWCNEVILDEANRKKVKISKEEIVKDESVLRTDLTSDMVKKWFIYRTRLTDNVKKKNVLAEFNALAFILMNKDDALDAKLLTIMSFMKAFLFDGGNFTMSINELPVEVNKDTIGYVAAYRAGDDIDGRGRSPLFEKNKEIETTYPNEETDPNSQSEKVLIDPTFINFIVFKDGRFYQWENLTSLWPFKAELEAAEAVWNRRHSQGVADKAAQMPEPDAEIKIPTLKEIIASGDKKSIQEWLNEPMTPFYKEAVERIRRLNEIRESQHELTLTHSNNTSSSSSSSSSSFSSSNSSSISKEQRTMPENEMKNEIYLALKTIAGDIDLGSTRYGESFCGRRCTSNDQNLSQYLTKIVEFLEKYDADEYFWASNYRSHRGALQCINILFIPFAVCGTDKLREKVQHDLDDFQTIIRTLYAGSAETYTPKYSMTERKEYGNRRIIKITDPALADVTVSLNDEVQNDYFPDHVTINTILGSTRSGDNDNLW